MTNRYHRQQQVPQFGSASQQRLSEAKVLIVGVGGLGSPVSTQLTGAGVGLITLVDQDVVSLSNLHRQNLFTEHDIGQAKALAGKQRLSAQNSEINIEAIPQSLSPSNAEKLVSSHTVVVDAADSFFVSYLLSDLCFKYRIPLVSASVLQTNGYVGVFCGTEKYTAPSMRAIFPSPPLTADNCDTAGVTGPSVGVIGSIQAQEVLKIIVQHPAQLLGKLLYLDLWDYRQNIVSFEGASEPTCVAPLIAERDLLETDVMLDVRSELEVQKQTRDRAGIHIPVDQIQQRHNELEKTRVELDKKQGSTRRIVCVCKSGQRALNAAHQLIELGHKNIAVAL